MSKIRINFAGGANTPTGSNFLLEIGRRKLLIDCGLYQGEKIAEDENRENFPYDPKSIDVLFVTHGHLDHVGRIPKLVREGFDGTIVSTPATKDIGLLVLDDSLGILTKEAQKDGLPPLYEFKDIDKAASLWKSKRYKEEMILDSGDSLLGDIKITLYDSGHILGSSMICFEVKGKKIMFTGDLGNSPSPLLRDTEKVKGVNYLIMESVYGDRNHEHVDDRVQVLKRTIKKVIARRGVLIIPAFSVERTQELIYLFNNMVENKEIPLIPVFLDSPLGINITKVYKKHERDFNENVLELIKSGDDIFSFAGLSKTKTPDQSREINMVPNPKIIIAGAGMSNGGRVVHHEARYLSDPKTILLLVGFQAAGTLGRRFQDGVKEVNIMGQKVKVNAEIVQISGFSAHKDSDDLISFAANMKDSLEKVFVVLGEPKSQRFLAQKLIDFHQIPAVVPEIDSVVEIDI